MINIKYQVVLFGNFEDISPKPDNLKYFIELFSDKELIPTTYQEIGPGGAVNRFSLTDTDQVWLIQFGSNRLDIQYTNKNVGVINFLSLDQFISETKSMIESITNKFSKKFNRLSLVTRTLMDEMSPEQLDDIYHRLNNSIDLYKENRISDWNTRTVSRIPYVFGDNNETFNVISDIKRVKGHIQINSKKTEIDRIELNFDLNTFQGNTEYRFDSSDFTSFADLTYKLESELKTKYLDLIKS